MLQRLIQRHNEQDGSSGVTMSDYHRPKKPEHRKDRFWEQHLRWWDVMSKQVDENLAKHRQQVKKYGRAIK
jgi:hypothetical protein